MSNKTLLTGAGFTHNFGAPLADGMWNLIYNNIQESERLKSLFIDDCDYESIYQKVITSDEYDKSEKKILIKATENAYDKLDSLWKNNNTNAQTLTDLFEDMIFRFAKTHNNSGYIFTLNQDLFIETRSRNYGGINIISPIMDGAPSSRTQTDIYNVTNKNKDFHFMPNDEEYERLKKSYENQFKNSTVKILYIKLHGSQNWKTKDNEALMIFGYDKSNQISKNKLLDYYFNLFTKQINIQDSKLLIIGYGFKDVHINNALVNAIENSNLSLHIVTPLSRNEFKKSLPKQKSGNIIDNEIKHYYHCSLDKMFPPPSANENTWAVELKNDFFESPF